MNSYGNKIIGMNEDPGGDEGLTDDLIWQDKSYSSGIHKLSSKEEIISIFEGRGYSTEQAETIAFWKLRGNEEINGDIRNGVWNYRIGILDGAIERSPMKRSHILYRCLGNTESKIVKIFGEGELYIPNKFCASSFTEHGAYEHLGQINPVMLEIQVKSGQNGLMFGDKEWEDEVLLPRTIKFRIIEIREECNNDEFSFFRYICEVEYYGI